MSSDVESADTICPDRILLVDDTQLNLQVLFKTLDGKGHELLVAQSGEEALEVAKAANPALILLDIMMPGIDGFETCRRLKADDATKHIAVIFMSALDDAQSKVRGFKEGAVDYIPKPFDAAEVVARVATHVEKRRLEQELARRNDELTAMNTDLEERIRSRTAQLIKSHDAVIFGLAKLAESRDEDTGQHLERICRYVALLAEEMEPTQDEIDRDWIETVTLTAALHDIGKVGVPDAVLCKPGRLTDEERAIIQRHTTIGGDTLMALKQRWGDDTFLVTATQIAFAHHEKWDGTGYPFGLKGELIPLSARLVAVADVYDALTSERVYKKGMTHEQARDIIVKDAGTHFDPACVKAFVAVEAAIAAASIELHQTA